MINISDRRWTHVLQQTIKHVDVLTGIYTISRKL